MVNNNAPRTIIAIPKVLRPPFLVLDCILHDRKMLLPGQAKPSAGQLIQRSEFPKNEAGDEFKNFVNEGGTGPENRFACNAPTGGISPASKFPPSCRSKSLLDWNNEVGIPPEKLFSPRLNLDSSVKLPKVDGIEPFNKL
nr:hypothetical protein Iba_chr03bCG17450 [Ipomoea batatas]